MKALLFCIALVVGTVFACTSLLVTPGASKDGTSMISYSADSAVVYGGLYYRPAADHDVSVPLQVFDWLSGVFLGNITQVNHTYNVVGNTNEWGVAIGETTFTGLSALSHQKGGILDYGSLIYLALQRSKTAREAIKTMTDLVAEYGYSSTGESFSIADPSEVWVLELIGKGNYELGAVWVARRVPDGHVTAHANHARISTFPLNDKDNCLYSKDVISFAKEHGFYPPDAPDEEFSFVDVYNPINFYAVCYCEMRVWSFFNKVVGSSEMQRYKDFIRGKNYKNRMPWSYKPSHLVSHREMIELMKDHYEGTDFEFESDVGAGPFHAPYRWRPATYTYDGHSYFNPRSISAPQTGWVFVAELRPKMPDPFKALNWFAVDDAATSVFMPMYGAMTKVPDCLVLDGDSKIMNFSENAAFWVFNLVANMAYDRWDWIHPEIVDKASKLQNEFDKAVSDKDKELEQLVKTNETAAAITKATDYSLSAADETFKEWKQFWLYLVAKYLDGLVKYPTGGPVPNFTWPGYGQEWYERIVKETGDKYLVYGHLNNGGRSNRPIHKIW